MTVMSRLAGRLAKLPPAETYDVLGYARNTGSGEPLASATRLVVADQLIYHDPDHPSGIVFSVFLG